MVRLQSIYVALITVVIWTATASCQAAPDPARGRSQERFALEGYLGMRLTMTQRRPLLVLCGDSVAHQALGTAPMDSLAVGLVSQVVTDAKCDDAEALERAHPQAPELLLLRHISSIDNDVQIAVLAYRRGNSHRETVQGGQITLSGFVYR